ncbi:MAG: NAD(P)H-hydrate dehydratase [Verrucomicrobiales bacterium]
MILTVTQMQEAEERLFATGVEAEPLMDRAGLGIAEAVDRFFPGRGRLITFVGPGHNGGDALVAARHLSAMGWGVELRLVGRDRFRPLTEKKLGEVGELGSCGAHGNLVLLDGLLGIGARGPLRGDIQEAAAEMNALRGGRFARTVAIDIPSGIDGDTGEPYAGAVVADLTLTIAQTKAGLLADAAIDHVGRLGLIPLDEIVVTEGDAGAVLTEPRHLAKLLPRRKFDTHKGKAGRVGIIAGSRGLAGAAVLCSAAAVRGGAGLVTLFVPVDLYPVVAPMTIPEVMVRPVKNYLEVREANLDVLAIGPGLGVADDEVLELIASSTIPCVIDADALNLIAARGLAQLEKCQGPRLLTPHPGEMEHLFPQIGRGRREWAEAFVAQHPKLCLLLKGARTIIKADGEPAAFNPTGHPGMATGGLGDVLTGLCAALIAQGLSVYQAGCAGSWLAGRAAELALGDQSEESFAASDTISKFGEAFRSLHRGEPG